MLENIYHVETSTQPSLLNILNHLNLHLFFALVLFVLLVTRILERFFSVLSRGAKVIIGTIVDGIKSGCERWAWPSTYYGLEVRLEGGG